MNQFCLTGKIIRMPLVPEGGKSWSKTTMVLGVERPFPSPAGFYLQDEFEIEIARGYAEIIYTACRPGDWVSVSGRMTGKDEEQPQVAESFEVEEREEISRHMKPKNYPFRLCAEIVEPIARCSLKQPESEEKEGTK